MNLIPPTSSTVQCGDYMYQMERLPDGSYHCFRFLTDDSAKTPEVLNNWGELPPSVSKSFRATRNLVAAL